MSQGLRNVIYSLRQNIDQSQLKDSPFNVVIVCFLLPQTDGTVAPSYELQKFLSLPGLVDLIKDGGKRKVLVSLGGANVADGAWAALAQDTGKAASAIWSFLQANNFDGIDFDFEETADFQNAAEAGYDPVAFLAEISAAVKSAAGSAGCLVSHAPQPPYFDPAWYGAPYSQIAAKAGDAIDWFNVQYYNNGTWYNGPSNDGPTQEQKITGLTGGAPDGWSYVALSQLVGTPPEKLVLGRVTSLDNAGSDQQNAGYLDAADTVSFLVQPLIQKFGNSFGGVMGWEYSMSTTASQTADAWGNSMNQALGL
ncbi:glycosyl hydrolase family 18 protein [Roseibium suaedae]|uniref:chitinase n=1 Tax=Roseibium suaedae TaxID=735517 RepID=A0A1M7AW20_9HYPH|nr:glycosyl hydrolase family 18 protein [Roseibium suaedae]SHL46905.1 Glycosyl hydrolases family 18 [Roseibium suaedae]